MLYDQILRLSAEEAVSDFHINEGDFLWVRKAGQLRRVDQEVSRVSREGILDLLRRNESHTGIKANKVNELLEDSGDRDFAVKVGTRRFRANLYWCNGQRLAMVLRQQPESAPGIESLGLPESFMPLLKQSRGLILVTGATGSGKTTTLASSLEYLNETLSGHIITLEDPVEYLIKSKRCRVDQRQIGRDVTSFHLGLRAALRQDPDVLLVGELRDFETVKTALDAANTGHLVMGTLHTNSAQQTIERVTSFFSDDRREWAHAVLAQALLGIMSQTLVPNVKGDGRVLAAEILVNTPDVKQVIREGRTHQLFNAMDTGSSRGQVLLNKVLTNLVRTRVITAEAAVHAAYDATSLKKDLHRESNRN